MKKTKKLPKILALLLAVIMTLSTAPVSVQAAGADSVIDKSETGSITLYKKDDSDTHEAIQGAGYTLYRVAEINQTLTNGVSQTTFDKLYADTIGGTSMPAITDINSVNSLKFTNAVVAALDTVALDSTASYTDSDVVKYAEQVSDVNGKVEFANLKAGYVYLAIETTTPSGVSTANNFLITVPTYVAESTDTSTGTVTPAHWLYDVVAEPKNNIDSSVTKKAYIKDPSATTPEYLDSVAFGSTVTYEIKANIPTTIYPYLDGDGVTIKYYDSYTINDTAGTNIEYVLDSSGNVPAVIEVWNDSTGTAVKQADLTLGSDYTLSYVPATSTTKAYFTIELIDQTIDFNTVNAGDVTTMYNKFNEGDYLVITYDAKIVDNDKSGTDDTTNSVSVITDGSDGERKLIEEEKTIETYDYRVWKVGEDTTSSANDYVGLESAEFALKSSSDEYMALYTYVQDGKTKYEWITYSSETDWSNASIADGSANGTTGISNESIQSTFKTDTNGTLKLTGLAEGSYSLVEVTAPSGYILLADKVSITVNKTSDTLANSDLISDAATAGQDVNTFLNSAVGVDYYSVKIINKSSGNWTLPQTGDMGIGIFIGIGALLMVAAIGLFVYNRKKNNFVNKA